MPRVIYGGLSDAPLRSKAFAVAMHLRSVVDLRLLKGLGEKWMIPFISPLHRAEKICVKLYKVVNNLMYSRPVMKAVFVR